MLYTSQRTLYGVSLSLAQMLGKEYVIRDNTTLNQLLDIYPTEGLLQGQYPLLQYFCIGTGGNSIVDGVDIYPYSNHSPLDAGLFNMVPLVLRETTNDLTAIEAKKYRLKKIIRVDGVDYIAYYLRKINNDTEVDFKENFYQISRRGNSDTIDILNLDSRDVLHPKPISKLGKIISNNSSYVTKLAKVILQLNNSEVQELKNSLDILKANKNLTEIGLVGGIDKSFPTGETEAICTQILYHVGMNIDLNIYFNTNESFYKTIDIGGAEPLFLQ